MVGNKGEWIHSCCPGTFSSAPWKRYTEKGQAIPGEKEYYTLQNKQSVSQEIKK